MIHGMIRMQWLILAVSSCVCVCVWGLVNAVQEIGRRHKFTSDVAWRRIKER